MYVCKNEDRAALLRDGVAPLVGGVYNPKVTSPLKSNSGCVIIGPTKIISKPAHNGDPTIRLKPSDLGVAGQWWSLDVFPLILKEQLKQKLDNQELVAFLGRLIDYHTFGGLLPTPDLDLPISEIGTDLGEMVGVIAACRQRWYPGAIEVYFPERHNEPMLDAIVRTADGTLYKISVKGGQHRSNPVNGTDVLELLEHQGKTAKWEHTHAYQMMKLIQSTQAIDAPFVLGRWMARNGFERFRGYDDVMDHKDFRPLCDAKVHEKPPTREVVGFYLEKVIRSQKELATLTPMFVDATEGHIHFVKFNFNTGKTGRKVNTNVRIIDKHHWAKHPLGFHSKNTQSRATDKIGIKIA